MSAIRFQAHHFSRAMDIIEKNDMPDLNLNDWMVCGAGQLFKFDKDYLRSNGLFQTKQGYIYYNNQYNDHTGSYFTALALYFGITYNESEYIFGGRVFFKHSKPALLRRMRKVMEKYTFRRFFISRQLIVDVRREFA